jgi:hypothetical protein
VTVGLLQQPSLADAPQLAARPWQLGKAAQTRLVVALHAVDSKVPAAAEHVAQVLQLPAFEPVL